MTKSDKALFEDLIAELRGIREQRERRLVRAELVDKAKLALAERKVLALEEANRLAREAAHAA